MVYTATLERKMPCDLSAGSLTDTTIGSASCWSMNALVASVGIAGRQMMSKMRMERMGRARDVEEGEEGKGHVRFFVLSSLCSINGNCCWPPREASELATANLGTFKQGSSSKFN